MGRKKDLPNTFDLYIIGEQLRVQLTSAGLIKDHRHHLRKHRKCFVSKDAIDWMVRMRHVDSRQEAVMAMSVLQEFNVIHHVTDDQEFKDKNLLYRFTKDDDTYRTDRELSCFYRGLEIHDKMKQKGNHLMRDFYHKGDLHREAFYGSDVVDFLQEFEGAVDRVAVVDGLQDLVERNIIKHLNGDYHFADDRLIYEFSIDFHKSCLLNEVLDILDRFDSFKEAEADMEENTDETEDDLDTSAEKDEHSNRKLSSHRKVSHDGKSIDPNFERIFRLIPDNVGFGLVLRGSVPCLVHTLAPLGPAAKAKIKVGQAVSSVNGQNVYFMSHREVGQLIAQSQGELSFLRLGVVTLRNGHPVPCS